MRTTPILMTALTALLFTACADAELPTDDDPTAAVEWTELASAVTIDGADPTEDAPTGDAIELDEKAALREAIKERIREGKGPREETPETDAS